MTKGLSRVTPADLAHRWGVSPLQVRRVLRSLYGTLKRQDRGPRWYLTRAEVERAAAVAEARDAATGWALLEAIPAEAIESYQPYWALAAHLLKRVQRPGEAGAAYSRAIGLCEDPAIREFLAHKHSRRPNLGSVLPHQVAVQRVHMPIPGDK